MADVRSTDRSSPSARLLPWALAVAGLAAGAWFGLQASMARAQNQALRDQLALAEAALKSASHQLEAERVISGRMAEKLSAAGKGEAKP